MGAFNGGTLGRLKSFTPSRTERLLVNMFVMARVTFRPSPPKRPNLSKLSENGLESNINLMFA